MSFMSELGARLVDNGYPVLPLMPGTKVPGAYRSGNWGPYPDWTKHCARSTTSSELDVWSRWPDAGIGIACGYVVGADIDIVQDAALCAEISGMAHRMLGPTTALRIGMAPKRLLVYRTETPFAGFKRHPIEILARGQQFVAHAIHPETGQPYYWPGESLADIDISQLPAVTEAQCRAFADAAYNRLPPSLRPATLGMDDGSPHHTSHYLTGTYDAIEDALRHLPNPDLTYQEWMSIGMAIKGALGDAGEALYARWSATSAKDKPAYTARSWRGYRPTSIGAGTIYYLAEQHGWHCPPNLTMNGAVVFEAGNHPAQAMLDALASSPQPALTVPVNVFVPDAFRQLDGVLGKFSDYVLKTAIRPQPILATAAAISIVGVLAGRRYRSPTNLRTNTYVVSVAESGGGKDHARKCIVEAFAAAGITRLIGGNKIASGSGLLTALHRQPASLFQLDEFGQFMLTAVDKRRAPKHIADIWDYLTELSTTAASVFLGAEYADQKERPRQDIVQPCCVVHATTTPGPYWKALQSGSLNDGSFARWLMFLTDDPIPDRVKLPNDISDVPDEIVLGLQAILAGADRWQPGNLSDAGANSNPMPCTVPYDGAADAALEELADAVTARQRESHGTFKSALLARVWEHVVKLAMIKAISLNPADPVIDLVAVRWAQDIVKYCTDTMIRDADRFVADNEVEANRKRVLDLIRQAGPAGLSRTNLIRKTPFLKSKDLTEVLHALVEGEAVREEAAPTATKTGKVYRMIAPPDG